MWECISAGMETVSTLPVEQQQAVFDALLAQSVGVEPRGPAERLVNAGVTVDAWRAAQRAVFARRDSMTWASEQQAARDYEAAVAEDEHLRRPPRWWEQASTPDSGEPRADA